VRVSIVGAGYVGLVTGACLAGDGHEVVVADVDLDKVDAINAAKSPIHESGLPELLARTVGDRLRATGDVADAVRSSDLTLVAVGTPSTTEGIDVSAVVSASRAIGNALVGKSGYHAVVVKSTVVPGTTDGIVTATLESASGRRAGSDLGVGVNPEFLTEGRAVADFQAPDRLVLGANDASTHSVLRQLYEPVDASVPRLLTNTRTAEAVKYASNALLATMISFANEIGDLCAAIGGIDVVDVMRGVHSSEYLSPAGPGGDRIVAPITAFLEAGAGFGGSCLPKDSRALLAEAERRGLQMPVLRAVLETNAARPREVLRLLEAEAGDLSGRRVTVLGLAFKPDTDDVRESPAIPIVMGLVRRGAVVTLHDPVAKALPEALVLLELEITSDLESALAEADAVVLVTRWDEYRAVPSLLAGREPSPVVVDGRRLLDRESVPRYVGIGAG
jgi:UDPglucose 6-dehydrogenase/GDP-mannose 6-dehydrogenase